MPQIDTYTAGTVTLTNGSAVVTGNATNWISGGLYSTVKGHVFARGTFVATIKSVDSATQITLYEPFTGTTVSGASYEILRYTRLETPEAVGFLQSLLARGSSTNPFTRVDLDSGSVRASFRDDGTGQLGWYVGTAGAADGSQVKAATVNKSTGSLTLGAPLNMASGSAIIGNFTDYRMMTASGRGWRLAGTSTGTTLGALYFQYTSDGFATTPGDAVIIAADGNVGVGIAPAAKLHVLGASATVASGYFKTAYFGRPLDVGSNRTLEVGNVGYGTYLQTTDTGSAVGELALNPRGGNVGIGTTAPGSKLSVSGNNYTEISVNDAVATHRGYMGVGGSEVYFGASGTANLRFQADGADRVVISASGVLYPGSDNTQTLGAPASRWSVVYAGTGTINTSDAREKTAVRPMNAAELRAAQRLAMEVGVYQWLEAVKEKGDAARQHVGMTVQRAIEIMEEEGLDPWAYGFVCRDEITRKVKVMQKRMVAKVEEVEVSYTEIEVRDGVPVQVTKTRTDKRPVTQMVPVLDEAGKPVLREIAAEEGEAEAETPKKGKRTKPQMEPVLHPVPVMVEEEVEVEIEEPAGDRLGFRPDQIDRFIMRGLAEKIALLDGK